MIRPLFLVALALLAVACATAEVAGPGTPGQASALAPRNSESAEASPVKDFEFHVRVELLGNGQYRRTVTERFTLLTASPSPYYARLETEFDPDEDDRPVLTATVTLPDGAIKPLDPATVAETPAEGPSGDNFTSRRRLVAPLPSLVTGAKIERQTVTTRSRPRLTVGRTFSLPLALHIPLKEVSLVLEHPVDQQIVSRVLEAELAPIREEKDGRVISTWSRSNVAAFQFDDALPPEERRLPTVMVSSAAHWAEVAGAYYAAVASRLTSKGLDQVVRELEPASSAPRDVAAAALEWMHHRLRYTGLDFDNSGVIPQTPEETLQRGYGDCKDLSAFLVALLDAAKVPAQLVLVHTADWHDAADEIAGLNRFDHAIVRVAGATPLWIDPTLRGLPAGTLHAMSMARMALVVDPSTTGLIRTPVSGATDNRLLVRTEITLPSYGFASVKTVRTFTGAPFAWSRYRAQNLSAEQLNQEVAKSTLSTHDSKSFTYRHGDPFSGLAPFEDVLEVQGSKQSVTADTDALAFLGFDALLAYLPSTLRDEDGRASRTGPVFVGAPHTIELVTRVKHTPLFELIGGPLDREDEVGSVRWSYSVKPLPDGAEARMAITFAERVIPADQVEAVRASLSTFLTSENRLEFANRPMRLMEDGKLKDAVRELRNMAQDAPQDALIRSQLARAAMLAGLTREALKLAREARDLGPMQAPVARTVGWILSVNPDGIEFGKGAARAEALEALRTARRLEPEALAARRIEIELLARNADGVVGGKGADIDEALKLLALPVPEDDDLGMSDFHALLLWESGRDRELLASKALSDSEAVQTLRLAARARSEGAPAALTWLARHVRGGMKDQLLAGAAFFLYRSRAHAESHQLAREVRDPSTAQLALLTAKTVRRDSVPHNPRDPASVVIEGLAHAMQLPTRVDAKTLNVQEAWMESVRATLRPLFSALPGAEEAVLDASFSNMTAEVESLPGVGVLAKLATPFGDNERHLLERQGLGYRFHALAKREAQELAAWKALSEGRMEAVSSWIKLWFSTLEPRSGNRIVEAIRERSTGDRQARTLALAIVAIPPGNQPAHLEQAIQSLAQARGALDPKHVLADVVAKTYVTALNRAGRHDEALALNEKVRAEGAYDRDEDALLARASILRSAKRLEVLEREGRALIERPETQKAGFAMLLFAAGQRKDAAAYRALHVQMAEANLERLQSLNNAAWSALFLDRIGDEDVQRAEMALGPKGDQQSALDTLAVLLAQRGDVDRAVATLQRLRGDSIEPETAPSVRYARGLIAEELGFTREAKAIYADIPSRPDDDFNDLAPLAKKRLAGLAVPAAAPALPSR